MSRCDSAAIVSNTSELLPEPDTPVNTDSRRLGISTLTSLRLFSRAPCTRMSAWLSASATAPALVVLFTAVLLLAGARRRLPAAARSVQPAAAAQQLAADQLVGLPPG